ncbi:cobalamin trafficking protein CblD-like [Brienomyrus brachyistius]|uniref:cobalamin trafficking protein CblD-like n=1 Tax=Brienomyrus brachyistius TaxID=42636 RepID=UPI0020B45836|nr:cobalamin trafficking protein CblD-like [Brienomyrus brachyistius]
MTSALCSRAVMVSRLPGIRGLLCRVAATRAFSTESQTVWPDENMGPFGPRDQRFQLPGNVGFACHLEGAPGPQRGPAYVMAPDVLSAPSSSERHEFILAQFITEFQLPQGKESPFPERVSKAELYFEDSNVECAIQQCPELLKQDFGSMFPEAPVSGMMVVTVTQKTQYDMTLGCEEVTREREELLSKFISGAKEICYALRTAGFWADFIDPVSGLAFFGSYAGGVPVDPAEKHHGLGIRIEDLGSCKVIRQAILGRHELVGALFTNAPPHSLVMRKLQGD